MYIKIFISNFMSGAKCDHVCDMVKFLIKHYMIMRALESGTLLKLDSAIP